jgi:cytochrome c556
MKPFVLRSRRWIAGTLGAAVLVAGALGLGSGALGQSNGAAPPKETIFARKILMDSINENMDDLEAMIAQGKIDLNEGKPHSNLVSVMLMAFPHLFPPTTNDWKPGGNRDPGTDTFAAPEVWTNFADFYKRSKEASDLAYKASRAETEAAFKDQIEKLRVACNGCHAAYLKKE